MVLEGKELVNLYDNRCPKCGSKTFKVNIGKLMISVICTECNRTFLSTWNEWVLNMDDEWPDRRSVTK